MRIKITEFTEDMEDKDFKYDMVKSFMISEQNHVISLILSDKQKEHPLNETSSYKIKIII